ncbi:MAG: hypothetical protein CMA06_05780 [Euryarchaeota archaeon]|nr:hypothetical protein [Euryarchaeota archaeon]RCH72062.1 MAG: hypothetical protein DBX06_02665 [Candidatus Poseidoniales archaeon]
MRGTGFCGQSANVDGRVTKPLLLLYPQPESRLALPTLLAKLQELPLRGVCPSFEPSGQTS